MLRNYLTIAWRNLLRHKAFSLINTLGLTIGMVACLLILEYVSFERSYDDFHERADRIYRVTHAFYNANGSSEAYAENRAAAGPAMKADLPEIQEVARLAHGARFRSNHVMAYQEVKYNEANVYYADATFLPIFSYPMLRGDAQTALTEPHTMVITESVARKYFGKADPIGKTITLNGEEAFLVKGVLRDIPVNSHLSFDFLLSFRSLPVTWNLDQDWGWANFYTYVLIKPGIAKEVLERKMPAFVQRYMGEDMRQYHFQEEFNLQPLKEIHLHSHLNHEAGSNGNRETIYFLLLIALLILLIAWINYVNLATARSLERAKEVGIRKVMGSRRSSLIKQFLFESGLVNGLAVVTALTLIQLTTPYFRAFTSKPVSLALLNHASFWLGGIITLSVGILLSGLYPAWVLSSFKPVLALKGRIQHTTQGIFLRKGLIVCQFAASIALMAGTLTIYQQLSFMRSQQLGFNLDQILVIPTPGIRDSTFAHRQELFKTAVEAFPRIEKIGMSSAVPGKETTWARSLSQENAENKFSEAKIFGIDYDFIPTYELKLLAGRNFQKNFSTDKEAILINEVVCRSLGFVNPEAAIGKKLNYEDRKLTIIGVVSNIHQQSLHKSYEHIAFRLLDRIQFYSLKLRINPDEIAAGESLNQLSETIAGIQTQWKRFFPENPFEYFFLDDYFNRQYQADQQFGKVFGLFSGLAIFIACLGLMGLASFTVTQRTKEIGVRKVLGATASSILILLSKDFLKLVLLSNLVAWPLAYWGINQWLQKYAFRIGINWWLFILPALLVLLIALFTISMQTWRAARANPIKALRYE